MTLKNITLYGGKSSVHRLSTPISLIATASLLALFLLQTGCVTNGGPQQSAEMLKPATASEPVAHPAQPSPVRKTELGTIAVAKIKIEHPTARLVYKDSGVSDTIVRKLKRTGQFRVIDWTRLEDVLFRRNLEWSDLTEGEDITRELRAVLLNDYFLMGNVTGYGEKMEYNSSAFSKSKTQVVSATVELMVKDALSNEIVATAVGRGEEAQQITQTLGFGAAGGNDTMLANKVLEEALDDGVMRLTSNLDSYVLAHPRSPQGTPDVAGAAGTKGQPQMLPANLKVLFLFAEKEDGKGAQGVDIGVIGLSVGEQTMAKIFHQRGGQVLTAGDVVNSAYSIGGGEDLIQGGWVTEEDLFELENLLQARSGLAAYAVKAGKAAGADIVVSGSIRFETQDAQTVNELKAKQGISYLTAKAIDVKTGKTLYVTDVQQDFMAIQTASSLKAKVKALQLAATKAANEILAVLAR